VLRLLASCFLREDNMEGVVGAMSVVAMFILRLGVPLAAMAVVVYLFHRLDARWQKEAWARWRTDLERDQDASGAGWLARLATPCWEEKGCEPSAVRKCPAHRQSSLPCWMARRLAEGWLPTKCYHCERFATVPSLAR
jgi:hypothetical protein